MRERPRLLDLYCKAGGASMGYHLAGFEVIGVDHEPQKNYPFEFVQADAIEFIKAHGHEFDAVHASPPCQRYSTAAAKARKRGRSYPDLIAPTREALRATGLPYVMENVEAAARELLDPLRLCGSSFGLDVRRHRLFETAGFAWSPPPCDHGWQTPRFRSLNSDKRRRGDLACVVGVHGKLNYAGEFEVRRRAMGIDWMTNAELTQAIPPAYTRHVGEALMEHLRAVAA